MRKIMAVCAAALLLTCASTPPGAGACRGARERDPAGLFEVFFAEGTTREGFDEFICMENPEKETARIEIEYLTVAGAASSTRVDVPARSRATIFAPDVMGRGVDFGVRLSSRFRFTAERPVYFDFRGATGSHCVQGIRAPSERWFFAEGYTGPGFNEYLCLANPGRKDARLRLSLASPGSEGPILDVNVPAGARRTVDVSSECGPGREVAAEVSSMNGVPVIAERTMYFATPEAAGGHCSGGQSITSSRLTFAEGTTRAGFREYLCVFNPGDDDIEVRADFLLEDGAPRSARVTVPSRGRSTLDVNALLGPGHDVSAVLSSTGSFCAERPVYFESLGTRDGHCAPGAVAASREWAFAEGTTRAGFRPFVCVANTGEADAVVSGMFLCDGVTVPAQLPVPAGTRLTVDPAAYLGAGKDFGLVMTSDRPVVAERVQYCCSPGRFQGGQCAPGDALSGRKRFGDVATYLNTYGGYSMADAAEFARYDVAALEPYDYPDASFPAQIRRRGSIVLAYIDVGEVEDYRSYWPAVLDHPGVRLAPNPDWPGCWYADVNDPEWRRIILEIEIPEILGRGPADGLLMDMLDTVEVYPELAPGMVELVRQIREWYPDLLLVPNRGFAVLADVLPYIDAFKYEEMSSGYDFSKKRYVYAPDEEALPVLVAALGRKDIPVLALDHVKTSPPDESMARKGYDRCARIASQTGRRFIWYANSVNQDHPSWPWLPYR